MADKNEINMITQKPKIYADYQSFQGNTFESNIKSINNLYLGQGIKISEVPFIIKEDKSNKNYIAVNRINIKTQIEEKIVYIPKKFIYIVFYFHNSIFYINKNNSLLIFKFESDKCIKFEVQHKKDHKSEITNGKNLKDIDLNSVFTSLKRMNESNKIKEKYEILTKILNEDLKEQLNIENPKSFSNKKSYVFNLNSLEYKCEVKSIEIEVDDIGVIRERIQLIKGQISLEKGINSLIQYVQLKKEGNDNKIKEKNLINNTFKCPIIYKNFDDDTIHDNQTIITEIKSGFDLENVKDQLVDRIEIINKCLFNEGEWPQYFIGLINLESKDVDKLQQFLKVNLNLNKKSLIISVVDSEYFGLDLSCEIHNEYLLYKKLNNMEKKLDDTNQKLDETNQKLDETNQKLDDTQRDVKNLNKKFDILIEFLKLTNPKIDIYFQKLKKIENEEKKS